MKKEEIFNKFKGIKAELNRAMQDIEILDRNTDYTQEYKNNKKSEIFNRIRSTYRTMAQNAIKEAEWLIRDKKVGYIATKVKEPQDKIYALNFYTQVIEPMGLENIINFMNQEENKNNSVYREIFMTKAETYRNKSDFKDGLFVKIDKLVDDINGDNIPEVIEYRDIIKQIQNSQGLLDSWNMINLNIEDGDLETSQSLLTNLRLDRGIITSSGNNIENNNTGEFCFNFKGVR